MAIAAAAITLPRPSRDIPFGKPVLSRCNVRRGVIKEGGPLLAEYLVLEEARSGQDEYRAEIEALELRALIYDPAEVVLAGAFATLDRIGRFPGCRRRRWRGAGG